jgi:hypothetical protein
MLQNPEVEQMQLTELYVVRNTGSGFFSWGGMKRVQVQIHPDIPITV